MLRQVISFGLTDVGRKRASNEDAFLIDDDLGLYAVADGMGGHNAGEVASQEAIDTVYSMVKQGSDVLAQLDSETPTPEAIRQCKRVLESALQGATYMVYGIAQNDPDQRGMGTTLSALALRGQHAITAQVGDSRIYLVRNGEAVQLTEDHTLVAWQIKQGLISEQEAALSPHRNVITRAVGNRDYVQVDTLCIPVQDGDVFILCSDGLYGYLSAQEIAVVTELGPELACRRLIELANNRGGRDNITAIMVEISEVITIDV